MKKLIVNIPEAEERLFSLASKVEDRTRNNFIITHSKRHALEVLRRSDKINSLFEDFLKQNGSLEAIEDFELKNFQEDSQ